MVIVLNIVVYNIIIVTLYSNALRKQSLVSRFPTRTERS